MGVHNNYSNSMYKQLEEMMIKIDNLLDEIKRLRLELEIQKSLNTEKDKQLEELTNKLNQALEELDKERSKNNKNSGNSSKPSSTDIAPVKKKSQELIYTIIELKVIKRKVVNSVILVLHIQKKN